MTKLVFNKQIIPPIKSSKYVVEVLVQISWESQDDNGIKAEKRVDHAPLP